jgi:adenine nucleotide transporter 17
LWVLQSTRAAALKIIKEEGLTGLYDGLSSSLVGIAVTNFIYYGTFEGSRSAYLKSKNKLTLSTLESMAVSAVAGAATTLLSNPIWVVNTRQT